MQVYALLGLSLAARAVAGGSSAAPVDSPYNLSPKSRTLAPVAIWRSSGTTVAPAAEAAGGASAVLPLTLKGQGAYAVLDFGKEVAGITTLKYGGVAKGSVGLAYSESNFFAACPSGPCDKGHVSGGGCACQFGATNQSGAGDHSNGGGGPDLTLTAGPASPGGSFTPPVAQLRGGFRYLNLFLESGATEVEIASVSVHFIAAPTAGADPSVYRNYFNSSDELLNRIWYGCAYTTQLCSIDPAHGRQVSPSLPLLLPLPFSLSPSPPL
jgi:hypothetical protein